MLTIRKIKANISKITPNVEFIVKLAAASLEIQSVVINAVKVS